MSTLLPPPDAPMMKKTSPVWTSKLTPSRTVLGPKDLTMFLNWITPAPHFGRMRYADPEMKKFSTMTASDEFTTARVVAQPTPSEPPKVDSPDAALTIEIAEP